MKVRGFPSVDLAFDLHDASEQGLVEDGVERVGINFDSENIHVRIVNAFETIDQRSACDGNLAWHVL